MRQINIITENRTGALDDILQCLGERRINVESLDVECAGSQGVVAIMVDKYDEALKTLTFAGYQAVSEDVLVMTIPDEPGALGRVSHRLKLAEIGIRSLRILARSGGQTCTVGLVTEDNARARELLGDAVVRAA